SLRSPCPRLVSPLFFFLCYRPRRLLPSFPTRRSSDLELAGRDVQREEDVLAGPVTGLLDGAEDDGDRLLVAAQVRREAALVADRSEEHTSELQSLTNLVCRLLLEKKKNHTKDRLITQH